MKDRFLPLTKISVNRFKDPICLIAFAQLFIHCIHLSFFPYFILFLQRHTYPIETVSSLVLFRELMKIMGIFLGGICSDLRNFKIYTVTSFALSSIGYFILANTNSLHAFFLGFGMIGFFYGFAYPGESNLIIYLKDQWDFRKIYSLIKTYMMVGALIAPFIGVLFVFNNPKNFGIVFGGFFLLYSCAIAFLVPNAAINERRKIIGYGPILKNFPFVQLVSCLLILSICTSILSTSLPFYLEQNFKNGITIYSIILSLNAGIVIVMQIFVSKLLEKFKTVNLIFYGIFLYSFVFLLLSFFNASSPAIIILFSLFTLIELVVMPNVYYIIIQFAEKEHIGKYQAFGNLRFFLAAPISAVFGKFFIGYKSFYFFSYFLLTLLSIPLFYFIKKRKQIVNE